MDREKLLALFDREQRREEHYPDKRMEVLPNLVRQIALEGDGKNFIQYTDLTPGNADQVIREQIEFFSNVGQAFEWKLYDYDQPADLKDRLAKFGFEIGEPEAFMLLELNRAPAGLLKPVTVDIRRIEHPDQLADVKAIQTMVWQDDFSWLEDYLISEMTALSRQISIYAAYVEGKPASAAWIRFQPGSRFAGLWGGSTLEEFRGRGLYTALVAARLQEALRRGVSYLTVDASLMSKPILENLGFEQIAITWPCEWEPQLKGKARNDPGDPRHDGGGLAGCSVRPSGRNLYRKGHLRDRGP